MRFLQFVYVTSKGERNNCSRLLKQPSNHWTPSDIQDVGKRLRDRQIKRSEEAWRTGDRQLFMAPNNDTCFRCSRGLAWKRGKTMLVVPPELCFVGKFFKMQVRKLYLNARINI